MLGTSQREPGNMFAGSLLEASALAATERVLPLSPGPRQCMQGKVAPHSNDPEIIPEMPWWKKRRSDKIWKKYSSKWKVKKRDHWIKDVKIHPRKDATKSFQKTLISYLICSFPSLNQASCILKQPVHLCWLWDMTTPPISVYNPVVCYKIT